MMSRKLSIVWSPATRSRGRHVLVIPSAAWATALANIVYSWLRYSKSCAAPLSNVLFESIYLSRDIYRRFYSQYVPRQLPICRYISFDALLIGSFVLFLRLRSHLPMF